MKKYFIILVMVMLLASHAHAAGIAYSTNSEIVNEGSTKCINYGVYNPFPTDVVSTISVSGDIASIMKPFDSGEISIKGGTTHDKAVPINLCFSVPVIFKEDCSLGPFLCEQKCEQEKERKYTGSIVVNDLIKGSTEMGSRVGISASTSLELIIRCNQHPRDYMFLYAVAAAGIIIALFAILYKEFRSPAIVRKERKLKKLQEEIEREKTKKR